MSNTINIKAHNTTSIRNTTPPDIRSGQIWRDANSNQSNRLLLVLEVGNKVLCQCLSNGTISKVRHEQFNRGKTGFFLAGTVADINAKYVEHLFKLPADSKDIRNLPVAALGTEVTIGDFADAFVMEAEERMIAFAALTEAANKVR